MSVIAGPGNCVKKCGRMDVSLFWELRLTSYRVQKSKLSTFRRFFFVSLRLSILGELKKFKPHLKGISGTLGRRISEPSIHPDSGSHGWTASDFPRHLPPVHHQPARQGHLTWPNTGAAS